MLQNMRDNMQGIVAYFIVGLIVVVFGLFGADALFLDGGQQPGIAEVNGKEITELDLRRAVESRRQQFRSMFGDNLDEQFYSDEYLREPALNSLIQRSVLESEIENRKLAVSSDFIDKEIVSTNMFQIEGKFDVDTYRQALRRSGYTPLTYKRAIESDYLLNQYQSAFMQTSFVTEQEVDFLSRIQHQKRTYEYVILPLAGELEKTTVSDEEVAAYYEEHKTEYVSEEQVSVEYIELRKNELISAIVVSEEDIEAAYQEELEVFEAAIERHAAHILIEEQDDGSHESTLGTIQQRLDGGEEFAELAREYSADVGSADSGGDVGFSSGDIFVPEFEEALQTLQVGEVSEPVETEYGYHIIKLLGIQDQQPPTLEESQPRIERELKDQMAEDSYVERLDLLRDQSYGAGELSSVAEALSDADVTISVKQSGLVSRATAAGVLRNREVNDTLFSEDTLAGTTSEVIEVNEGHAVVLRLLEHKTPEIKSLEEMTAPITERLKREKAGEQLKQMAQSIKQRVYNEEALQIIAEEAGYSWEEVSEIERGDAVGEREILNYVFTMAKPAIHSEDIEKRLVIDEVPLLSGDLAVVLLSMAQRQEEVVVNEEQLDRMQQRLESDAASSDFASVNVLLSDQADISRPGVAQ